MIVPLVRYGVREGRKRDWRVCLTLRGSEGEVVIARDRWEGMSVRARNWEERRDRWESTGRTLVSA